MLIRLSIINCYFDKFTKVCDNALAVADPTPSSKPESTPIFPPGLHQLSVPDLDKICVGNFPSSKTRRDIFSGLQRVIKRLNDSAISGHLWIDGSFLTEKIDPEDVDVLLHVPSATVDSPTASQKDAILWIGGNLKATEFCDSYVLPHYNDTSHPLYWHFQYMLAYWMRQFGFSRGTEMKGIGVIALTAEGIL